LPRGLNTALFKPALGYFGSVVATGNYIQTAVSTLINASLLNNADVDVCQPGSPGLLTIVADYTQTSGGALVVEIGGPNAGTNFDLLNVTGQAALDGTLTVNLVNGFVPNSGDNFAVLTVGSATGVFANINGDRPLFTLNFDPGDVTLVAN
jgi:hypothetical protein